MSVKLVSVTTGKPEAINLILGQAHFINVLPVIRQVPEVCGIHCGYKL